jgi:hypothetical protein
MDTLSLSLSLTHAQLSLLTALRYMPAECQQIYDLASDMRSTCRVLTRLAKMGVV